MRSGPLRHRLAIQSESSSATTFSGSGGGSWANISTSPTVWAEKIPLRGNEVLEDGTTLSENWVKFGIRYRSDLTTKNRIVYGTHTFNIRWIQYDNKNRRLILWCEEVT